MNPTAMIEKALMEGYATSELTIPNIFLCICFASIIGIYVAAVYRFVNKNSFYNPSFGLSLTGLAVITSSIILTIQSNIVISLGMVGALSIVRFRTAIKEPVDLVFLFWAISIGIITGAGFAMIAIITSVAMTIIILLIKLFHIEKNTLVLIVNTDNYIEDVIESTLRQHSTYWRIKARNISENGVNMAIEVRTHMPVELLNAITGLTNVVSASLLEHEGEITA